MEPKTETKEIDGRKFEITEFGGIAALKVATKLSKLTGISILGLAEGLGKDILSGDNVDDLETGLEKLADFEKLLDTDIEKIWTHALTSVRVFLEGMDAEENVEFGKLLLSNTRVNDGNTIVEVDLDKHFTASQLGTLSKVILEVLKVNFGPFFGTVEGFVSKSAPGGLMAALSRKKASPSPTTSTGTSGD